MKPLINPINLPPVTRGSDIVLTANVSNFDLTDRTVSIIDESAALKGRVSGEIDSENSAIIISIEGTKPIRVGKHEFRVQLNLEMEDGNIDSIAWPLFILTVG
jgi:hypothetical protein